MCAMLFGPSPSDSRFTGVSGPWVSADNWWHDCWNATQSWNVLVITCCSRFTSFTWSLTGLIVGSPEVGFCQTPDRLNGIQWFTCKVQVGCIWPQHFFFFPLILYMLLHVIVSEVKCIHLSKLLIVCMPCICFTRKISHLGLDCTLERFCPQWLTVDFIAFLSS